MHCTIHHSEPHITFAGESAVYCTLREAVSGRLAGRFQIVFLPDGSQAYRSMDRTPYPADVTIAEAMRLAITEETRKRQNRPPRSKRSKPQRGIHRGRWKDQHTPPARRKAVTA